MQEPKKERVRDKIAAKEAFCKVFEGKVKELNKSVGEAATKIQSDIRALAKENEEAAAKISEGAKKLSREIEEYVRDFY